MIGMYGSSPKVKCREDISGAFQLIAELQISSRDRVSISPRSCIDFFQSAQAETCVDFVEIVCRFRQVFVRVQLIFGKSSPRWRIVGREEIEEIKGT